MNTAADNATEISEGPGEKPRTNRGTVRRTRILSEGGAQLALVIQREAREALELLTAARDETKTAVIEKLLIAAAQQLPKAKPAAKRKAAKKTKANKRGGK